MAIIVDTETNGLMPYCTKMHCAVAYDTETEEFKEFTPANIDTLPDFLAQCAKERKTVSMHNGLGFDFKVLKKLYDYVHTGPYLDSLLMARVLWPDIEMNRGGLHTVDAWGVRFGLHKPVHEDWAVYTPEMLHRCKEDVKIQAKLYQLCIDTVNKYEAKDPRLNRWVGIFTLEQKFWQLIEDQADHGWLFDVDLGDNLVTQLTNIIADIDRILTPSLPQRLVKTHKDQACTGLKKDGKPTQHAKMWVGEERDHQIAGDFCRIKWETVSLNSPQQVKEYLIELGWHPENWNYKKDKHGKIQKDDRKQPIRTSPKLPEDDEEWERLMRSTKNSTLQTLAVRGKANKRLSTLKGYIKALRCDRRIEAQANSCATNTGRAAHKIVVNVPKAKESVYFGKEFRSLFTVPEGKVLVGGDASALEARMEAHYLYPFDKAASFELLEGDIHTINAEAWGVSRDTAKGGKYALLYGAGGPKLALTLGKPVEQATGLVDAYWGANPGTKQLITALERQHEKFNYLVGIDGRPLTIRYKHALLNTLLQNAGAVTMKMATVIFMSFIRMYNIPCEMVGNFHDEIQAETLPEYGDVVGLAIVDSIRLAGEYYKLNVPLDGEYKIGKNWAETH